LLHRNFRRRMNIAFNWRIVVCFSDGARARLRLPAGERNDPAGSRRYLHLRGEQPRWIPGESFLLRERRSLWQRQGPGNYFTINLCPPVMDYLIYYLLLLLLTLLLSLLLLHHLYARLHFTALHLTALLPAMKKRNIHTYAYTHIYIYIYIYIYIHIYVCVYMCILSQYLSPERSHLHQPSLCIRHPFSSISQYTGTARLRRSNRSFIVSSRSSCLILFVHFVWEILTIHEESERKREREIFPCKVTYEMANAFARRKNATLSVIITDRYSSL